MMHNVVSKQQERKRVRDSAGRYQTQREYGQSGKQCSISISAVTYAALRARADELKLPMNAIVQAAIESIVGQPPRGNP
jgi:hypothetical protein